MPSLMKPLRKIFIFLFSVCLFSMPHPLISDSAPTPKTHASSAQNDSSADEHRTKQQNTARAHLMALGTWMVSTTNYWLEGAKWEEDIDFRLTLPDQMKRLFSLSSYRFDSNTFATNWQHALSGAVFYNIYRSNGFSLLKSFKYSIYTSLLWEYLSEYQEVISINDMIYNTLGALSAGETLFQTSHYLHQQDHILMKSLGWLLNPIYALNRLLDGRKQILLCQNAQPLQHIGTLSFSRSHGDLLPEQGQQSFMSTKLEIDLFPQIKKTDPLYSPLTWQSAFLTGHFSFSLTGNATGINEYRLKMRNMLMGWLLVQNIDQNQWNLIVLGFGNGFDLYRKKAVYAFDTNKAKLGWEPDRVIDKATQYSDKFSQLGIIGSSLLWIKQNRNTRLRLEGGVNLNFAMINSLPINGLSRQQTIRDTKITLLYYGYYYALGYSCFARGDFEWKSLTVSFSYDDHHYQSIDGLDRFQDQLLWDPQLTDSRSFLELGLYIRPFRLIQLGCVYEQIFRRGRIDQFKVQEKEARLSFTLGLRF